MVFRLLSFAVVFCLSASRVFAFGLTADQMYRNLLTNENHGVLPSYYSASKAGDEPLLTFKKTESKTEKIWHEKEGSLMNVKQTDDFSSFNKEQNWPKVVESVKNGRLTPFDLETIQCRSEQGNAEAVELLAWMYATGTGLHQNLTKSWAYYLQAAHLGVPSATANARAVYKVMSSAERAQLPAF